MYRLTGSSDWHQLSDTIRIAVESSGSVRVRNLSSAFEQCELWSYYRSTASGFITIDQQDGDCQFGAIRVSNTGPVVYDEENYPYEYSIDGTRFSEKASFDSLPAGKYKVFVHDNYGELDPELAYSYRVKDVLVDVQDSLEVATEIFCVGEQIEAVFTIHGSNGYEDDPWLYIVDDSLRSSDGVFSGLLPGHHIVEVKNLNSGCTTSAGFDVTVIDSVAAEVSNPTHEGVGGAVVPRVFSRGKTHNILFQVSNENYTSPWLSLTDTLRGLANGEYLLTVQNRIEGHYACEKSTSFTIKQVLPIDASVVATALSCHGELSEVNVEASGGNGSFLYRLDSGHYKADSYFQSVRGGNHIITVKDTDNSVTQVFFNIPEPDPISLEVAVTGPVCYEDLGYAKISASGGSGEYSFIFMGDTLSARSLQWIPIGGAESAFGTIPALVGKHQLTILDGAGCTSSVHFEVGYDESNETASLQVNGRVCYEFGEVHVGVQDKDDRTKYLLNQYPDEVEGRQCTDEAYFEVKMLSPLQLQISAHDPVCSSDDGYAEVMVAGGTPPYEYQLSGNGFVSESVFQHLAEGEYELSVRDANGCEVTEGFYLNENPQEIQLETIVYEPRCPEEHGAVTISTDMKGTLLYKINDRPYQSEGYFDDLKAGDYKVMVQSEYGCLLSDTFSITSTNATEFEVDVKDATCPENADGAIYMPSDLSYQTYYDGVLIRDGLKGLSAGTYMINYVDESGCNGVEEVVVGYQYEYPDIPIITSNEGWLEVMDSDYIVTWYRNGVPMSVGDDVHRIPAYPGAYQVSLAAGAGYCEVFSDVYDVPSTETRVVDEIMVMPNPVISKLSVLLPENYQQQLRSVSVLDLSGQVLRTTSGMSMNLDLPGGIYLIRIQGEGFDVTRRFIKQ